MSTQHFFTGFLGQRRLLSGPLSMVALAAKRATEGVIEAPVLIFDDHTGRQVDIDTRGTEEEIQARYATASSPMEDIAETSSSLPRGRGRPKLGVVAREVTLLPRHWEWLASQPGGPSVALRKLVEAARRAKSEQDKIRERQERAYHFMAAMVGDMPGFEEAVRALFANESAKFGELIADWPSDIRDHAMQLAFARREDGAHD